MAINPQDLRLGNLVSTHMGIGTIQQLRENYARVCVRDDNQVSRIVDYDFLFGIPLAPEWLERMGFIHNSIVLVSRQYLIKLGRDRMLSVSDAGTPNEMVFIQEVDGKKVTDLVCVHNFDYDGGLHVHQLMNLYHALTGNELTWTK